METLRSKLGIDIRKPRRMKMTLRLNRVIRRVPEANIITTPVSVISQLLQSGLQSIAISVSVGDSGTVLWLLNHRVDSRLRSALSPRSGEREREGVGERKRIGGKRLLYV